jgi:hypothetical protein
VIELDPSGSTWEMTWYSSKRRAERALETEVIAVHFVSERGSLAAFFSDTVRLEALRVRSENSHGEMRVAS